MRFFHHLDGISLAVQHTLRRSLRKLLTIFRRVDSLLRPPSDAVKHAERTLSLQNKTRIFTALIRLIRMRHENRTRAHHLQPRLRVRRRRLRRRPRRARRSDASRARAPHLRIARDAPTSSHTPTRARTARRHRSHRHIARADASRTVAIESNQIKSNRIKSMRDSIDVVPVASSGFRHPSRSRDSRRASPLGVSRASPARPRVPRATCDYAPWPPPRARRVLRYSRVLSFVHPSNPCTLCASADDKNRGPSNSDTRTATDRPAATARLGGRGAREDARTDGRADAEDGARDRR